MMDSKTLRDLVEEELDWEPSLEHRGIGVAASDGVLTLTGHVGNYAEKRVAEKAAKRVRGVLGVANELEVRIPAAMARDDTDIAQAAVSALKWRVGVPEKVKVVVSQGWVTLEGQVEWQYQSRAAEAAVRNLVGVRGVTNLIAIKPRLAATQIKTKIEDAFRRGAQLNAAQVQVRTEGGKVSLSGTVHSWAERAAAEHTAWAAAGVTEVDNQIRVEAFAPVPA